MEACTPVAQHLAELDLYRAGEVLADQIAQIALPCDKTNQGNGTVGVGSFHQLDQFGALTAYEVGIGCMAGKPQHKFIQEQDDGVVAQVTRVATHDAQTIVKRNEGFAAACQRAVSREKSADQITHKARALFSVGGFQHGSLKADGIPTRIQRAPATGTFTGAGSGDGCRFVELGEKRILSQLLTQFPGVLEQALRQVETWYWCTRVLLAHKLGVLPEHSAFHVTRTHHVVRHQQKFAALRPAVACHHICQFWRGTRLGITRKKQVQHGHEMALARAKAAVQVGGLAGTGLYRLLNEPQCIVERVNELRSDHVVPQRLVGMGNAIRQLEYEVALVNALGDVN